MTTIVESRYGEGWLAFNLDYWELHECDYFEGLNGGDHEHIDFIEQDHDFPIGHGLTPAEAFDSLKKEIKRFNEEGWGNYKFNIREEMKRKNLKMKFTIYGSDDER